MVNFKLGNEIRKMQCSSCPERGTKKEFEYPVIFLVFPLKYRRRSAFGPTSASDRSDILTFLDDLVSKQGRETRNSRNTAQIKNSDANHACGKKHANLNITR